jgi:hypothetical protein
MPVSIESTNDSKQVQEDFRRAGININVDEEPNLPEGSQPESTPSEEPGEPGDKIPAETGDKTVPEPESGKTKSQEPPSQGEKPEDKGSKGGFISKLEKKTRQLEQAREELEAERGDKSKLRERIEELEAQIQELKPAPTTEAPALVKPKRPARPDLADFDYDATKYGAAMKKYDAELASYDDAMDEYRDKVAEQKTAAALKQDREQRQLEEIQAKANQQLEEFNKRVLAENKAEFPDDWKEFWEENQGNFTPTRAMEAAIMEDCEHPALVCRYMVENPEEYAKYAAMSEVRQANWIARLDVNLWAMRQEAKKSNGDTRTTVTTPEKKAPATQVARTPKPDAPIEPVGGRPATANVPKNGDEAYASMIATGNTSGFVSEFNRRAIEREKRKRGMA